MVKSVPLEPNMMDMQGFRTFFFLVSGLFLFQGLFCSCKKEVTSAEGEKYLRAFDNTWVVLMKQASESDAYRAFQSLISYQDAPLPFRLYPDSARKKSLYYPFDSLKGIFYVDTLTNQFLKIKESDSVIVVFPVKMGRIRSAKFIISDYREEKSVWGIPMPMSVDIKMETENKVLLRIQTSGKMNYQVPVFSRTTLKFDDFECRVELKNRLSKKGSPIRFSMLLLKKRKAVFDGTIKVEAWMDEDKQVSFREFKAEFESYPIKVAIRSDYTSIDPSTQDFIGEFNRHTQAKVLTSNNRSIGNVLLKERAGYNRLNFAIEYHDGSWYYLEEFLFIAEYLLNVKQ